MRTPLSLVACLAASAALMLPAAAANAAAQPAVPQLPGLEILGLHAQGADGAGLAGAGASPLARSSSGGLRLQLPQNLARLVARAAAFAPSPRRAHRELRSEMRSEGLAEYIHVGPLRGRRFTVTAISDQACATVRYHRRGSVDTGPCTRADLRASMTPLQDSANLLVDLARESLEYGRRSQALRELYAPQVLRWYASLIAPEGVAASGVVDGDRDGVDDDGRVAFHANDTSVCATMPVSRDGSGRVSFGSCRRLAPRRLHIHERALGVFREMKHGADIGASFRARTMDERVRNAANMARAYSSHPEARARANRDRVQFRARVNDRVRFACYRVSPDGHRATYSRSGKPGTWRLGHCR